MMLLITGAFNYTDERLAQLRAGGWDVRYIQDERIPLKEQNLDFRAADIDAVVCNALFLYNDIEDFTNLKFVQLISAGLDRVPVAEINKRGIELRNARGVYSAPMAEYAMCGVLQILKHARQFADAQRRHEWRKDRGLGELSGKTVGIVGCGSVGTECAKRFGAFDCKVVGVNRSGKVDSSYYGKVVSIGQLDEILPCCDVLILALPLTEETRGLVTEQRLGALREGAILVNIARGNIVDEQALVKALEAGKLGGAVLDVFDEEPLPADSPLWDRDNVIVTPHNSFVGEGAADRLWGLIVDNLAKSVSKAL